MGTVINGARSLILQRESTRAHAVRSGADQAEARASCFPISEVGSFRGLIAFLLRRRSSWQLDKSARASPERLTDTG